MIYSENKRLKQLHEIEGKINSKLDALNQPIYIQDLFVCGDKLNKSFGESNFVHTDTSHDKTTRLTDHIRSFFKVATISHRKNYCELVGNSNFITKPDCLNKITRLSLHEFSLYTQEPLSLTEFYELIEEIRKIAHAIPHQNIHLLLSSFAVDFGIEEPHLCSLQKNEENFSRVVNVSIYVQCGDTPKLHVCCKATKATNDIKYYNKHVFSQYHSFKQELHRGFSNFVATMDGLCINNNNLFILTTEGGSQYLQTIDICLDYFLEFNKTLLFNLSEYTNNSTFIPRQVNHLLTSNSMGVHANSSIAFDDKKINPVVSHVDPRYSPNGVSNTLPENILNLPVKKYPAMKCKKYMNVFLIKNPPFGNDYQIRVQPEKKLTGYSALLEMKINQANKQIKQTILKKILKSNLEKSEAKSLIKDYGYNKSIHAILESFYSKMLNSITLAWKEKLFESEIHLFKLELKQIFLESYKEYQCLHISNADFISNAINVLQALVEKIAAHTKYQKHKVNLNNYILHTKNIIRTIEPLDLCVYKQTEKLSSFSNTK